MVDGFATKHNLKHKERSNTFSMVMVYVGNHTKNGNLDRMNTFNCVENGFFGRGMVRRTDGVS